MNIKMIRQTLDVFKEKEDVIEIRAIKDSKVYSGYYKDIEKLIADIQKHPNLTWYFVFNKINEACYSRKQSNKIISEKGTITTGDSDITRLKWLLIDIDPVRPSGVNSTDEEKLKAKEKLAKVYEYLKNVGFSEPVICDSGNGYHMMYRIEAGNVKKEKIETENELLIKRFLESLNLIFSDDCSSIDTVVYNPSRITKLYGSLSGKGSSTEDRPHRHSSILKVPEEIKLTSSKLINKVADIIKPVEKPRYTKNYDEFNIDDFISRNGIRVAKERQIGNTRKILLEECPFDSSHKSPDSAILVMQSGALAFHCFHNSCSGYAWKDLRDKFEPDRQAEKKYKSFNREEKKETSSTSGQMIKIKDIKTTDRSKMVAIKSNITQLDKLIGGFNKGELSIWSGGNASGKSTLLNQLALESRAQGYATAMYSGELQPDKVRDWLLLQAAGRQNVMAGEIDGRYYVSNNTRSAIYNWMGDLMYLYDNNYSQKVGDVLKTIVENIKKDKIDVIIIDNLMSLDVSDIAGDKNDKQGQVARKLKLIASEYNVHIHFVCHPRKQDKFLRKYDISGSSDLTNMADNVFMVHRVNEDFIRAGKEFFNETKISKFTDYSNVIEVMKNRDLGKTDEFIGVYFEQESKRFLNERFENKLFGWEKNQLPELHEATQQEIEMWGDK